MQVKEPKVETSSVQTLRTDYASPSQSITPLKPKSKKLSKEKRTPSRIHREKALNIVQDAYQYNEEICEGRELVPEFHIGTINSLLDSTHPVSILKQTKFNSQNP